MAPYSLPELRYDPSDLEPHLSARIVELHHDKHHATYVKGANAAVEAIEAATAEGRWGELVGLERTLAFNLGGHVLHSIYWTNLSPDGGGRPDGELAAAIDDAFGDFDRFRALLTQATTGAQGSGWGLLSWEPLGGRLVVQQLLTHQDNHLPGSIPVLAIDAWEHAYYLQYSNVRADYVEAIWHLVDWRDVASRFAAARAAGLPT